MRVCVLYTKAVFRPIQIVGMSQKFREYIYQTLLRINGVFAGYQLWSGRNTYLYNDTIETDELHNPQASLTHEKLAENGQRPFLLRALGITPTQHSTNT